MLTREREREREREAEMVGDIEREWKKGDRERQRGQERDRKRRGDQLRKPNHRGIWERAREAERRRESVISSGSLRKGGERGAWSVCVRSVVQLINLWQEGFLCSVPWIAALIYMVIFFKTLAAYKKPFISIFAKPKPFSILTTYKYT